MSEVKRYRLDPESCAAEHPQGDLVDYHEYARLKAKVNRLIEERCFLNEKLNHFVKQTVQNREQVERLRKAGDDLYKSMLEIGCNEMADNFQYDAWWGSMRAWQSSKEGKPSV